MLFLLRSLLHVLHLFYYLFTLVASWKSRPQPQELSYPRKQIPRHLALLLASDGNESTSGDVALECFLESIQRTVGWCRAVGVRKLTVYDRDGTAISIRSCISRVTNINSQVSWLPTSNKCRNVFLFPLSFTRRMKPRKSSTR